MKAGMGAQAARSEKRTISPTTGGRDLGTMRDYVPDAGPRRGKWLTNKLIAERAAGEAATKLSDWLGRGELAKW
jgi:hypothetical protein